MIPILFSRSGNFTIHLFLIYVLISGNYIGDLMSCSFQRLLKTNILYQHILAFCIFYLTISIAVDDSLDPFQSLYVSFISYIWFVISCRMSAGYISILLFITFFTYLITNIIEFYQKKHESDKLEEANLIVKTTGFSLSILTTLIGFIIYYRVKRKQYNNNWNWKVFIIGKQICRNKK